MGNIGFPLLGISSWMCASEGGCHPANQHADEGGNCYSYHAKANEYPNATQTHTDPSAAYTHIGAIG